MIQLLEERLAEESEEDEESSEEADEEEDSESGKILDVLVMRRYFGSAWDS